MSNEVDAYTAIENFSDSVKGEVEKAIITGIEPYEALALYGIKRTDHERMMAANELWRNWIASAIAKRNRNFKEKIITEIEKIPDPKDKAKALMDFYKQLDKEFGAKYIESKNLHVTVTKNPMDYDKIRQKAQEDAEKS